MERMVFLFFVVFSFTLNPAAFASPARKGEDPRIIDKAFAEAAGLVCGTGFNKTLADGNYAAGDSFCVGELPLGKTISQSPGFGPGSKGEESLVDFLSEIPEDSDLIIGCFNDEVSVVGCQNALSGKANACNTGMAAARCQNAFNLAIQANSKLFGRTTQVLSSIKGVRQVVFLVKKRPVVPASGNDRCTAEEVAAAEKIKLAGDHTEAIRTRVVVIVEGQRLPTGVEEEPVTLTIPGYDEAGKGFIVRHPKQVRTCRVGMVKEGALPPNPPDVGDTTPPDPPDGYPPSLRPIPAPERERETNCNNRIDDDGDGKIDCKDEDCRDHAAICQPQDEICDDGIDNDFDGFTDKADKDCLPKKPFDLGLNLQAYVMGYMERPPFEQFRHMANPGLEYKNYANPQVGLGVPFITGGMVIIPSLIVAMRTTEWTAAETTGPLLGDRHAWVVGGELSLLKKVGKTLWAGVEPGFYYGTNGVDPFVNGKVQFQLTPRVGVAVVLGVRYVENHLTEEPVLIPRIGLQISFTLDPTFK